MPEVPNRLSLQGETIVDATGHVVAFLTVEQARAIRRVYTLMQRLSVGDAVLTDQEREEARALFQARKPTRGSVADEAASIVDFAMQQARSFRARRDARELVDAPAVPLPPIPLADILRMGRSEGP